MMNVAQKTLLRTIFWVISKTTQDKNKKIEVLIRAVTLWGVIAGYTRGICHFRKCREQGKYRYYDHHPSKCICFDGDCGISLDPRQRRTERDLRIVNDVLTLWSMSIVGYYSDGVPQRYARWEADFIPKE